MSITSKMILISTILILFESITSISSSMNIAMISSSSSTAAISTSIANSPNSNVDNNNGAIGSEQRCEKITIPMCMDIGYNYTSMPNLLEMETQEEAGLEVHQFWPLVEINCSDDLKFFLCSMYAPICIEEYPGHIPSCKSVCERAREGCKPIMIQYGFPWPDKMNCSELPVYGDGQQICMDPKKGAGIETDNHFDHQMNNGNGNLLATTNNNNHLDEKFNHNKIHHNHNKAKSRNNNNNGNKNHQQQQQIFSTTTTTTTTTATIIESNTCRCDCRQPYFIRLTSTTTAGITNQIIDYNDHHYQSYQQHQFHHHQQQSIHHFNYSRIETAYGLASICALSCKGLYHFNENEQETAFFWIGITAAICAITCMLTVFTSLTDTERFRYPERAIIFLAACYIFIAGGYLLRIRLGHNAIACDGPFIRYQRTGPTPASCILSFILLYFFGMASAYWWLILTLTWFLAAGLKWSSEAITSYAQYFHLLAWLLPTAQSVTILCLGAIDGDPFMGVCSVGNQSRANLLIFVITPLCVCIAIGILFLFTGFVALFRIRRAIRQTQHTIRVKTDKLEKLMIRIGLSSFLYIVPEVVVVACHIYEYIYRPLWEKSLTCLCNDNNSNNDQYSPQFSIIILKYIMSLIIGITSSFWIWSGKTLESWMRIYTKISCCSVTKFGSPNSSSRSSGASQLLPNMGINYYGRDIINGSSLPMKTQTVNLGPTTATTTTSTTPLHHPHSHHLNQLHHHHQQHLHHHHQLNELQQQSRQASLILQPRSQSIPPPPSLPPPPPPLMANHHTHHHHHQHQPHHHSGSGSLTGSQFTHMIGSSINGTGNNSNSKIPLSHV
uniref:Frizzled-5-like n=1 Tax=Dermatophagoides pteronyssinus TaxID=6956 RepID=A0A6P6YBB0_DERPT|nr:frizzled-5-like [Dermatophagoides pteronyssinus]